uniref:Uncharacterized protein n=1 Tax=Populus davidiana TaxID=266767 RepID=A0A6M2F219_9ROSI
MKIGFEAKAPSATPVRVWRLELFLCYRCSYKLMAAFFRHELSGLSFCNNERLMSNLQLSKNKHNGCSLYLSNVLAEFRFSTSKDSKLHLVLGYKITLLQGRSPVIWQLKSTEERRSIHCLTKSGNQRVQKKEDRSTV